MESFSCQECFSPDLSGNRDEKSNPLQRLHRKHAASFSLPACWTKSSLAEAATDMGRRVDLHDADEGRTPKFGR